MLRKSCAYVAIGKLRPSICALSGPLILQQACTLSMRPTCVARSLPLAAHMALLHEPPTRCSATAVAVKVQVELSRTRLPMITQSAQLFQKFASESGYAC